MKLSLRDRLRPIRIKTSTPLTDTNILLAGLTMAMTLYYMDRADVICSGAEIDATDIF